MRVATRHPDEGATFAVSRSEQTFRYGTRKLGLQEALPSLCMTWGWALCATIERVQPRAQM